MTATAAEEWQHWSDGRAATVSAPHGQLALTGTHWLEPEPHGDHGLPGVWWADAEGVRLRAAAADGVTVAGAGAPVDGEALLRPDTDPAADTAALGEVLLVPIEREGEAGPARSSTRIRPGGRRSPGSRPTPTRRSGPFRRSSPPSRTVPGRRCSSRTPTARSARSR